MCAGVDLCAGVDCSTETQCTLPGECKLGQCPSEPLGTGCNDGNDRTTTDVCVEGAGRVLCAGEGLCLGKTCPAVTAQCRLESQCPRGECLPVHEDDATPCDDRDDETVEDHCEVGECVGRGLCAGVACDAASTCQDAVTCSLGECSPGKVHAGGATCLQARSR